MSDFSRMYVLFNHYIFFLYIERHNIIHVYEIEIIREIIRGNYEVVIRGGNYTHHTRDFLHTQPPPTIPAYFANICEQKTLLSIQFCGKNTLISKIEFTGNLLYSL